MKWADEIVWRNVAQASDIPRRANEGFGQNSHANELKTMIVRSAHLTVQLLD